VTADMKLTRDDDFTLRVVQLSELLAIRHCVFLMGPTGSGRTEVYKVRVGRGSRRGGWPGSACGCPRLSSDRSVCWPLTGAGPGHHARV
jgi:hypothetical protein